MNNRLVMKGLVLGIIMLFVGTVFLPCISGAIGDLNSVKSRDAVGMTGRKTIYVDDDWEDDPPNHKWNTITEGIADAETGDTVFVYNGTYVENLIIDVTINLIGEDKKETIIGGDSNDSTIYIYANNVYITNFAISYGYYGIYLVGCEGCTITINDIWYNIYGIYSDDSTLNNNIYLNNFDWNEELNAYDEGTNNWDNGKLGNYWDDYLEKTTGIRFPIMRNGTWVWNKPYPIPGEHRILAMEGNQDNGATVGRTSHPVNKPYNYNFNLLNWFFERFPSLFLILRNLLELR